MSRPKRVSHGVSSAYAVFPLGVILDDFNGEPVRWSQPYGESNCNPGMHSSLFFALIYTDISIRLQKRKDLLEEAKKESERVRTLQQLWRSVI